MLIDGAAGLGQDGHTRLRLNDQPLLYVGQQASGGQLNAVALARLGHANGLFGNGAVVEIEVQLDSLTQFGGIGDAEVVELNGRNHPIDR